MILIEGERIRALGHVGSLSIPEDAEVISTEGMSVLPGLWERPFNFEDVLYNPEKLDDPAWRVGLPATDR